MRAAEQRATATAIKLEKQQTVLEREIGERKSAQESCVNLLHRIVSVQEEERRRLSRELHDECGQNLTALHLELKMLENALGPEHPAFSRISSLRTLLDRITDELQHLARRLRPSALDDLGLASAVANHLETWMKLTGITVDYECRGGMDERLPAELETALYRVLQEALTNVARHSGSASVNVILSRNDASLALIFKDLGCGFLYGMSAPLTPAPPATQLGLLGMRERMHAVGGSLEIESNIGQGTTIFARVPVIPNPELEFPHEQYPNPAG